VKLVNQYFGPWKFDALYFLNVLTLFVDFLSFYTLFMTRDQGSQAWLEAFVGYRTYNVKCVRLALDAGRGPDYFY